MSVFRLAKRGVETLLTDGLFPTFKKVFHHIRPQQSGWRKLHAEILSKETAKMRFTEIYKNNFWSNKESISGPGSDLNYTKNLREALPELFEKYKIKRVLDAPCGDFYWMKEVLKDQPGLSYVGGDIVEELVEKNRSKFSSPQISFEVLDITKSVLPTADLIIVRDCLFHLGYADIKLFLENLSRSRIKYLLTTTHLFTKPHRNIDIVSGDFRFIDIFTEPFCFPNEPIERIDDWIPPDTPRQMCLFEVASLPSSLSDLKEIGCKSA